MNTFLVNGTFNSVDSSRINHMLKDGVNTIKIKITFDQNNKITMVKSSSGNIKLDAIFENSVKDLLQKNTFYSPCNKGTKYSGAMLLTLNYLKR
jgi:hypothetical protein